MQRTGDPGQRVQVAAAYRDAQRGQRVSGGGVGGLRLVVPVGTGRAHAAGPGGEQDGGRGGHPEPAGHLDRRSRKNPSTPSSATNSAQAASTTRPSVTAASLRAKIIPPFPGDQTISVPGTRSAVAERV